MGLKNNLNRALNEKDVENTYRNGLLKLEGGQITSPHSVDGLLEAKNIRSLLEFKYEHSLKNKLSQCNILIQCLYYIKKFENSGKKLPTTIFVGDINECFAIHTNSIIKYLSAEIDWKIAPSEAYKKNPELIQAMVGDTDILPFVFDIDENFTIQDVVNKIKDFTHSVVRKVRITKHSVVQIFNYFDKNILGKVELTTNEKANLFIQIIINPSDNYIHPKRKNILTTNTFGDLKINSNLFKSFFKHFEGDIYSPKEKEQLTGLVDRLVEDVVRRQKGEFFTPVPFVDLSHKYIADTFGDDWKDKYVVWDCASGTGNLTRDYKFKELYISTFEQSDIDTSNQMGYNMDATKFQYDFLNDGNDKLPQGLKDAIASGKEIIFLINPPYATANNMGTKKGDHKGGVSSTMVGDKMRGEKWGASSQNLYAQFLYRIYKCQKRNTNVNIAIFCNPNYLTGGSYKKFREKFFSDFGFENGFLFQASHFSDVSTQWGINFAVFSNKINDKSEYIHDLIDFNDTFELEVKDLKTLYNTDGNIPANKWVREEIKGMGTVDVPQISSYVTIKQKGRGNSIEGALGYFYTAGNNVEKNGVSVGVFSSAFSNGNGLSVIPENFLKTSTLFTARKTIRGNWVNDKDEYLAPNETHEAYEQFTYDSLVYSLFNNSSQQSSLRQVDYTGEKWDIKNEFFWLSKDELLSLAEEYHYDELYRDAKNSEERFVSNKLFGADGIYDKLSPDARKVLDMATELLKKSIQMRKVLSDNHPEYHLDTWDAGYAQLKLVWGEYFKEEFKEFRDAYKEFESRLKPLVYELGFLRK